MKQALLIFIALGMYIAANARFNGFTENRGQVKNAGRQSGADVLYTAECNNAVLFIMKDRIACVLKQGEYPGMALMQGGTAHKKIKASRFDIILNGNATVVPMEQLPGYSNYYLAHCPQGITSVPSFSGIIYKDIYDRIDLLLTQNDTALQFDFIVHNGGDPSPVRLMFEGEDAYRLNKNNTVDVSSAAGVFRFGINVFSVDGDEIGLLKGNVSGSSEKKSPVVQPLTSSTWATYIGGSDSDEIRGIALDAAGDAYCTGYVQSTDLPVGTGTVQDTLAGGYDSFVFKIDNATGNRMWATYYGGTGTDFGYKIKVHNNMPVICGYGSSADLPMMPGAWQPATAGSYDGFIVRFNPNGTLNKTTYFGGPSGELLLAMDVDNAGNIFTGGATGSVTGFPVTASAFQTAHAGAMDAFCAKFDTSLALVWATYYGGSGSEDMHAMTLDDSANVIFSGGSFSTDFPVSSNAFQSVTMGGGESYIVKLDSSGARAWATYIGGYSNDDINGLTADRQNNIYIAGYSESLDFPVTANAYQSGLAGGSDAVIAKIKPDGTPAWITFYGGSLYDYASSIDIDTTGNLFIGGYSNSTDFPVSSGAFQPSNAGSSDGFFLRFDTAQAFGWATYFGGAYDDYVYEIAVDDMWNVFIDGTTNSLNLPDTAGVMQPLAGGNGDGFMAKLDGSYGLTIGISEVGMNGLIVYPNPASEILFIDLPPGSEGSVMITDISGRKVKEAVIGSAEKMVIDTSRLTGGLYFLHLNNGKAIARFIKL